MDRQIHTTETVRLTQIILMALALLLVAEPRALSQEPPGMPSPDMAAPAEPLGEPSMVPEAAALPDPTAAPTAAPAETAAPVTQINAQSDVGTVTASPDTMIIPLGEEQDRSMFETAEGQNLINVTVENETLENVVNMFARISGANIVTTSADLGGTVTVNLRGVEWRPALSSILDVHNLALTERLPGSGVYTIVPRQPDAMEPLQVQTVFLKFTTVGEMAPLVRSMIATVSNAAVSDFPSRNAMVVKTSEGNMREIDELIKQMDVAGRQVVVETKFMELSDGASKQLGIRWDSLEAWGATLRLDPLNYARGVTRGSTRSETSTDDLTRKDRRDQDGRKLNDPVSPLPLPVPEGADPEYLLVNTDPSYSRISTDSRAQTTTYAKSSSEAQAAVLEMADFQAIISALNRTEGVTTISNPKLVVASGSKDAYFTVGDREPIIKVEVIRGTQDSPGDTITAELDTAINTEYIKQGYLETGIHLEVIPVVKTDDLIEATITPKLVRRILPDKVVGDNSWPRIAVKQINTTFTLRSGQTVAIGGLTDNTDDKKVTKIPLLGDIPLLGKYLFSHTADVKRQVETIIFVTLSMAEAEALYRESGIPEEAELVHREILRREHRQVAFDEELSDMRKAAEDEATERTRVRLLNRPR